MGHAETAATALPHGRVTILGRSGHLPRREHSQAVNQLGLDFLAD